MKGKIFVLKRDNGFCGIYKDGKGQENLVSNSPMSDSMGQLVNSLLEYGDDYDIIFTDDNESFKTNLPSLSAFLGANVIVKKEDK